MPREARLDAPGLMHHIIARGIKREKIFLSKNDYDDFLTRVEFALKKSPNEILAWALMPNHFHMLVRSGSGGIITFMRRLMSGYAGPFNKRHKRVGYLFQNRYKSIICDEERYLLELARYIHLNPLRAKIVANLEELKRYPYSGHGILMGFRTCQWQNTREILDYFGDTEKKARKAYEGYIFDGIKEGRREDLIGGGLKRSLGICKDETLEEDMYQGQECFDSRILGPGEFVEKVWEVSENEKHDCLEVNGKKIGIKELARYIARELEINDKRLFERGRTKKVSEGKSMLIYIGVEHMGRSIQETARLTRMTGAPASRARERGRLLFEKSEIAKRLKGN